jgi:hypothetical protein
MTSYKRAVRYAAVTHGSHCTPGRGRRFYPWKSLALHADYMRTFAGSLKLDLLNAHRRLAVARNKYNTAMALLEALSKTNLSRVGALLNLGFRQKRSLGAMLDMLGDVVAGIHSVKGYDVSEAEFIQFIYALGGRRVAVAISNRCDLPHYTTARRLVDTPEVSVAQPGFVGSVIMSIAQNLRGLTKQNHLLCAPRSLCVDEVFVRRAIEWQSNTDSALGMCQHYRGKVKNLTHIELNTLQAQIRDGSVHYAKYASCVGLGSLGVFTSDKSSVPDSLQLIGIIPTCGQRDTLSELEFFRHLLLMYHEKRRDLCDNGSDELQSFCDVFGELWEIGSDGDPVRRRVFATLTTVPLSSALSGLLDGVVGIDKYTMAGGTVVAFDDKHCLKRWKTFVARHGVTIGATTLTVSTFKVMLEASGMDKANIDAVFQHKDAMNVPAAIKLLSTLGTFFDRIPVSVVFHGEEAAGLDVMCAACKCLAKFPRSVRLAFHAFSRICYLLLLWQDHSRNLVSQLEHAAELAYLLSALYNEAKSKFVTAQLYHDVISNIKAAYFRTAQSVNWLMSTNGRFVTNIPVRLCDSGSDYLEEVFAVLRGMFGADTNFTIRGLADRARAVAVILAYYAKHPEVRPTDKRRDAPGRRERESLCKSREAANIECCRSFTPRKFADLWDTGKQRAVKLLSSVKDCLSLDFLELFRRIESPGHSFLVPNDTLIGVKLLGVGEAATLEATLATLDTPEQEYFQDVVASDDAEYNGHDCATSRDGISSESSCDWQEALDGDSIDIKIESTMICKSQDGEEYRASKAKVFADMFGRKLGDVSVPSGRLQRLLFYEKDAVVDLTDELPPSIQTQQFVAFPALYDGKPPVLALGFGIVQDIVVGTGTARAFVQSHPISNLSHCTLSLLVIPIHCRISEEISALDFNSGLVTYWLDRDEKVGQCVSVEGLFVEFVSVEKPASVGWHDAGPAVWVVDRTFCSTASKLFTAKVTLTTMRSLPRLPHEWLCEWDGSDHRDSDFAWKSLMLEFDEPITLSGGKGTVACGICGEYFLVHGNSLWKHVHLHFVRSSDGDCEIDVPNRSTICGFCGYAGTCKIVLKELRKSKTVTYQIDESSTCRAMISIKYGSYVVYNQETGEMSSEFNVPVRCPCAGCNQIVWRYCGAAHWSETHGSQPLPSMFLISKAESEGRKADALKVKSLDKKKLTTVGKSMKKSKGARSAPISEFSVDVDDVPAVSSVPQVSTAITESLFDVGCRVTKVSLVNPAAPVAQSYFGTVRSARLSDEPDSDGGLCWLYAVVWDDDAASARTRDRYEELTAADLRRLPDSGSAGRTRGKTIDFSVFAGLVNR